MSTAVGGFPFGQVVHVSVHSRPYGKVIYYSFYNKHSDTRKVLNWELDMVNMLSRQNMLQKKF